MNFNSGETSGNEGLNWLKKILLVNPDAIVILMTAYGDIDLAVTAMKKGAVDFIVKPWDNKKFTATVMSAYQLSKSKKEIAHLRTTQKLLSADIDQPFSEIIGDSDAMKEVYTLIEKVGKTDANVLVLGENGTGKELVARALHRYSGRSDKIFMGVDLGAVPESLFESELFGHVRGAFTDAKEDRPGRFAVASNGTLFLDEIGNLSLSMQSKLLSVIQKREVTPIGSNKSYQVDIRLICATNMPLYQMVEEGTFRRDLLYRINTVEINIPPLRDRSGDIELLCLYFLDYFKKKYKKGKLTVSAEALKKLQNYYWPGNIRELRHVMERAVIMTENRSIKASEIMVNIDETTGHRNILNLQDLEKNAIRKALRKNEGNLSSAAKELGLGRTTLYRKITKYGL